MSKNKLVTNNLKEKETSKSKTEDIINNSDRIQIKKSSNINQTITISPEKIFNEKKDEEKFKLKIKRKKTRSKNKTRSYSK